MRPRKWLHRVLLGLGVVIVLVAGLVYWQAWTPSRVDWRQGQVSGMPASVAHDLVLQGQYGGSVWASRGYSIYQSEGGEAFEKVITIVPRWGEPWVGFLRCARDWWGKQELVEVVVLGKDTLVVFAGGDIYHVDLRERIYTRTFSLRYFGRGVGRGVMSRIAIDEQGAIYWGEYAANPDREPIAVYRSDDEGQTWDKVHEFAAGEVRHVHGLEWDPYEKRLWMVTGDKSPECRIGYSLDRGRTWHWIGQGSQQWRACALLFTPKAVIWATDTSSTVRQNYLMRWDRETGQTHKLQKLPFQSLYAQGTDDATGLVAMNNRSCSVWLVQPESGARKILEWDPASRGQPAPRGISIRGCRLARGTADDPEWLYLNPLRTGDIQAAIYRVRRATALAPIAQGATETGQRE